MLAYQDSTDGTLRLERYLQHTLYNPSFQLFLTLGWVQERYSPHDLVVKSISHAQTPTCFVLLLQSLQVTREEP